MVRTPLLALLAGSGLLWCAVQASSVNSEEEECVAQLQVNSVGQSLSAEKEQGFPTCCEKLAGEVTKECDYSNLMPCIGGISNKNPGVKTGFEASCAGDLKDPVAQVYKVTNDSPNSQVAKATEFCFGDKEGVKFAYAMTCMGQQLAFCKEQGCMKCDNGVATPKDETCDFKPFETKYMTIWYDYATA